MVLPHHHGECRDRLKHTAYIHEKFHRYAAISIPIYHGIFKLIFLRSGWYLSCER